MPSRRTEALPGIARRVLGTVLALVLLALGWCYGVLYVEGESMRPALGAGDVIVYRRYGQAPGVGEMVVFEHRDSLVVHRVLALSRGDALRTKGDANSVPDIAPVESARVKGTVVFVVPSGRAIGWLVDTVR